MKMSDGEKLIAMMLTDLLKRIGGEGEIDPDFVADVITSGHLWALKREYPGVFSIDETDDAVVSQVHAILGMSRVVEHSIEKLKPEERDKIPAGVSQVFVGFDGNYETDQYSAAQFMVEKLGLYEELKARQMNSHAPMLPTYERQLKAYNHVKGGAGPLSLENIMTILAA